MLLKFQSEKYHYMIPLGDVLEERVILVLIECAKRRRRLG
jgi:hypothetical protein